MQFSYNYQALRFYGVLTHFCNLVTITKPFVFMALSLPDSVLGIVNYMDFYKFHNFMIKYTKICIFLFHTSNKIRYQI